MNLALFWKNHGDGIVTASIQVFLIIGAYYIVRFIALNLVDRAISRTISKMGDAGASHARQSRLRALQSVLRSAVGIILGFIVIVMLFQAITGTAPSSLLAAAGVAGIAVGFGAQKLVKDVVSGVLILMEDQYGVGDYVTIGAVSGTVKELALRTTRIRDNSGKLYIISNGDIAQVCNHSRGKLCSTLDIGVSPSSDIEKAKQILDEIGQNLSKEMPQWITHPIKCEGIAQISGEKSTLRLTGGVVAAHQDEVNMALNERICRAFAENEIGLA